MSNLYFIVNTGCDDETIGVARISDEDFPKFKDIIENLNKNSTYCCMPTIRVYKIDESEITEVVYNPDASCGDDDYCMRESLLYLEGKTYKFTGKSPAYAKERQVI